MQNGEDGLYLFTDKTLAVLLTRLDEDWITSATFCEICSVVVVACNVVVVEKRKFDECLEIQIAYTL